MQRPPPRDLQTARQVSIAARGSQHARLALLNAGLPYHFLGPSQASDDPAARDNLLSARRNHDHVKTVNIQIVDAVIALRRRAGSGRGSLGVVPHVAPASVEAKRGRTDPCDPGPCGGHRGWSPLRQCPLWARATSLLIPICVARLN